MIRFVGDKKHPKTQLKSINTDKILIFGRDAIIRVRASNWK